MIQILAELPLTAFNFLFLYPIDTKADVHCVFLRLFSIPRHHEIRQVLQSQWNIHPIHRYISPSRPISLPPTNRRKPKRKLRQHRHETTPLSILSFSPLSSQHTTLSTNNFTICVEESHLITITSTQERGSYLPTNPECRITTSTASGSPSPSLIL